MRIPFYVHEGIDVIRPCKSDPFSAGTDFFIPNNAFLEINCGDVLETGGPGPTNKKITLSESQKSIVINPGSSVKIHSGISMEVDFSQMALVCNRSGIASKNNLIVGAHVIDTWYTGEVCFDIHNIGSRGIRITAGDKITQVVLVPIISASFMEVSKDELYRSMVVTQVRGNAGFGASDQKK